jgi:hypothetical protein
LYLHPSVFNAPPLAKKLKTSRLAAGLIHPFPVAETICVAVEGGVVVACPVEVAANAKLMVENAAANVKIIKQIPDTLCFKQTPKGLFLKKYLIFLHIKKTERFYLKN